MDLDFLRACQERAGQGRGRGQQADGPYNFFSVKCKADCPAANATPPFPWDPDPALELRFREDDSFKSQIVRETPLTDAAKNMNKIFTACFAEQCLEELHAAQHAMAQRISTHCTELHSQQCTGSQNRLHQAA